MLLFFDISGGEIFLILVVAFLVFGPSKIPEIARKIGRGLNEIRRASDEIKREITRETNKIEKDFNVDDPGVSETTRDIDKGFKDLGKDIDTSVKRSDSRNTGKPSSEPDKNSP
jgi:sec-independent protein translocase protein TatA